MKTRVFLIFMLTLLVGIGSGIVLAQENNEDQNPLLQLLRYVPNSEEFRGFITYGNLAAWAQSWALERVTSLPAAADLEDERSRGYWLFLMPQQVHPPDTLGLNYFFTDDQLGYYGFDLTSLDRFLLAGQPPSTITVADFGFDPTRIAAALTASGYEAEPLDAGGTLYSILDDFAIDIKMETVKTRTGQLGNLNRIAVLDDGRVVIGKATGIVTGALSVASGALPSLADDPFYTAAAEALFDPQVQDFGQLTGVILLDVTQFGVDVAQFVLDRDLSVEERAAAVRKYQDEYLNRYPLPPFILAAFATYHAEGATYLVLGLVFPPGTDVQAASEALQSRFENYTSVMVNRPIVELLAERGAAVESVLVIDGDLPVTLLVVRNEDPPPGFIPGKAAAEQEGGVPFEWMRMIFSRDTGFLIPAVSD